MSKGRIYNTVMNSIFGIVSSFITIILNFILRIVLVKRLGAEINGLHNLFQSIASVMTIMELGISSAMVIHLYRPVAEKNIETIKGIMAFYRKAYTIIACAFAGMTVFVSLFLLDKLVTTTIELNIVRIYFIVFGMSFVCNYFTYYKRSILYAEQKNRVSTAVTTSCEVIFRSIQIATLFLCKDYIIFLILWIIEKTTANIICIYLVNKHHPYLKKNHASILPEKKRDIIKTVKPLVVSQTANTICQSSKAILISMLLGNVSIVGYFGNYQLVTHMIEIVYTQFGGAFTSSFGNLAVTNDRTKMKLAYKNSAFVMNWIAAIFCSGFVVCIRPFITIVFGKEFVLDSFSVITLTLSTLIYLINIPIISIQNAMGLHRLDSMAMVLQAFCSIILGYVGGSYFGMPGIFLGLLIPTALLTTVRKEVIIAKQAFDMQTGEYIRFLGWEFGKIILTVFTTIIICGLFPIDNNVYALCVYSVIACTVGFAVPALLSIKTSQLGFTFSLLKKLVRDLRCNKKCKV